MLGRLVKGLRMLGYDTLYWGGESKAILELAGKEGRVVLTRKRSLLETKDGLNIVLIRSDNPQEQLKEIIRELDLSLEGTHLSSRCLCCNGLLIPTRKEEVEDRVPHYVYQAHKDFTSCSFCGRIYWKGTHLQNMERRIQKLREDEGRFIPRNRKDPL